MSYRKPVL